MNPIFPESPQDWTTAKVDKIFYNSKKKAYTSTVLADEFIIPEADLLEGSKKYYADFVKNVLANLNKESDSIDTLLGAVNLESNFIDPAPFTKEKLLLSIPEDSVANLKEKPEKDTTTYLGVVYDLGTFFNKITNVAKKFQDYQVQMISNIFNKNNKAFYSVDFLAESSALYEISSNISSLLESNNIAVEKYSQIEISYTEEYKIECIKLIDDIERVEAKYLFEDFRKSYPQDRPRTVKFLTRLVSLNEDIQSNSVTYEDIINDYIQEGTNVRQNYIDLRARSSEKGVSASVKNEDISKKYDSLKNISQKSVKNTSKRNFKQCIQYAVYDTGRKKEDK